MIFLLCFLALSALAGLRTLPDGEALAFEALFGTSDMKKLLQIEANPQAHWREREEYLTSDMKNPLQVEADLQAYWRERVERLAKGPHKVLTHLEFCEMLVEDAQESILQNFRLRGEPTQFKLIDSIINEVIDTIMKDSLPPNSPLLPNIRAMMYAKFCKRVEEDCIDRDTYNKWVLESLQKSVIKQREILKDITHDLNDKLCWHISPDGKVSIFDWLVMRSKGWYLCGAPSDFAQKLNCKASRDLLAWEDRRDPLAWEVRHTAFKQALRLSVLDRTLQKSGHSYQKIFDTCCNPQALIAGDIVTLSQQLQGWFHLFYEAPSYENSFDSQDPFSLFFPRNHMLLDKRFCAITPYFTAPLDHDWHKTSLKQTKTPIDPYKANEILTCWQFEHSWAIVQLLPTSLIECYISRVFSFQVASRCHECRYPQFYEYVLRALVEKEGKSRQMVDSDDQTVEALKRALHIFIVKNNFVIVRAPASVCWKLFARHAQALKKMWTDTVSACIEFSVPSDNRTVSVLELGSNRVLWNALETPVQ